jgi:hypothetical protein
LLAQWPLHSLELPRREPVEKSTIPGLDAYREAWDRAVAC